MAKSMKREKVMFFTEGPTMTEDEEAVFAEIQNGGFDVSFRNAALIRPDTNPEDGFDHLAGAVPDHYADKWLERRKKLGFEASDVPAEDGETSPPRTVVRTSRKKGGKPANPPANPPAPPAPEWKPNA